MKKRFYNHEYQIVHDDRTQRKEMIKHSSHMDKPLVIDPIKEQSVNFNLNFKKK